MTMVILTIPLGIIGVVIGLLLFKEPFGFMPFLGVISLAGIPLTMQLYSLIGLILNKMKLNDLCKILLLLPVFKDLGL